MAHILAADIGGTNCRLAHFSLIHGRLTLHREVWLPTAEVPSTDAFMAAWTTAKFDVRPHEADAMVLAVAGPVPHPLQAATTNAALRLDLRDATSRYKLRCCHMINDFIAQAYACVTTDGLTPRAVLPWMEPPLSPAADGTRAVVGAGTGLGTASLIHESSGLWRALPAEGGHTAFPLTSADEMDFGKFVCQQRGLPYARGDDILTGTGLSLLHTYLSGEHCPPDKVAEQALQHDTPTRQWFARFYGRFCRHWMLNTLCLGGLYIAGGIAAKNPGLTDCAQFRDEVYHTPQFAELIRSIPVTVNTCPSSGLWGAAWVARQMLQAAS